MAGTNQKLGDQLPRMILEPGNIVTDADIIRIGDAAEAGLLRFLRLALYDQANQTGTDGVLGEPSGASDHLAPTKGVGDRDYVVEGGVAFIRDTTGVADPFVENQYVPVILPIQLNGNVAPHDVTNPRIDILTLGAVNDTDTPESRKTLIVSGPNAGQLESPDPTTDVRRHRIGFVNLVAGTPAPSPVAPAVPAGEVLLATITVPATSGPITVQDDRRYVQLSEEFRGMPPGWMQAPHVVGGPTLVDGRDNLLVSRSSATQYAVTEGWYSNGREWHWMPATGDTTISTLPIGNNTRFDFVCLDVSTGLASVVQVVGSNVDTTVLTGSEPFEPDIPADHILLARLQLDSTGLVAVGDVVDRRTFGHVGVDQIGQDAVAADNVVRKVRTIKIPGASFAPDQANSTAANASNPGWQMFGLDTWSFIAGVDIPAGARITEAGWVAYSGGVGTTMEGGFTRTLIAPDNAAAVLQNISADPAPVAIPTGSVLQVNKPAFFASQLGQIAKEDYVYGLQVTFNSPGGHFVTFVGGYVIIETDEILPGSDGALAT